MLSEEEEFLKDVKQDVTKKVASKKKKRKKNKREEEEEQIKIVRYLTDIHPNIEFTAGAEGIPMQIGMVMKLKRLGIIRKGNPDLMILEPNKKYHGLVIELKKKSEKITTKTGKLVADEHIEDQMSKIQKFRSKGYYADFCFGALEFQALFKKYLNNEL